MVSFQFYFLRIRAISQESGAADRDFHEAFLYCFVFRPLKRAPERTHRSSSVTLTLGAAGGQCSWLSPKRENTTENLCLKNISLHTAPASKKKIERLDTANYTDTAGTQRTSTRLAEN